MSTYTKTTNFTAKDNLTSGDPAKVIKGSEFDTEFNAIETAVNSKANSNNTTLTGTATVADVDAQSVETDALSINSTTVTATAAEINTLDGITASTAELNITDGLTASTSELNILDGATLSTTELNLLDGVTATTAELNILDGVTSTTTEINKLDGFTGTVDDLNYAKDLRATGVTTAEFDKLDGLTATTAELNILDGATVTTSELNILDGVTATASELNITDGLTATTAELNTLDGITATTTELNYTDGVTSNIQTQLDGKATTAQGALADTAVQPNDDVTLGTITTDDINVTNASGSADIFISTADTGVGSVNFGDVTSGSIARGYIRYDHTTNDLELGAEQATKLSVTGTGIDVTGTVTADGLTVDGAASVNAPSSQQITFSRTGSSVGSGKIGSDVSQAMGIWDEDNNKVATFYQNQDVEFYEDTGTTAKLKWDASQEQLNLVGNSSGITPFSTFSSGYTSEYNSYSAEAGLQIMSYQSDAGSPYTKTSDLIANGDGTVPSEMRFLTKANGSSSPSERLRIDSAGKVGIGTSSPSSPLEVNGGGTNIVQKLKSTDDGCYLQFNDDDAVGYYMGARDGNFVLLDTSNSERMRIDSSGNVGIGTSTPDAPIDVVAPLTNSVYASFSSTDTRPLQLSSFDTTSVDAGHDFNATSGNGELSFSTGSTERLRIDSSGNVGIGTSSPADELHVSGASDTTARIQTTSTTAEPKVVFVDGSGDYASVEKVNRDVKIKAFNTDVAHFTSSGNVGIGTSSPSAPLDVAGEALIQGRLQVTSSAPEVLFSVPSGGLDSRIHNDGSGNFIFGTGANSSTPTEAMRIDSSRNLLVGTTTSPTSSGGVSVGGKLTVGYQGILNGFGAENASGFFYSGGASGGFTAINSNTANGCLYLSKTSSSPNGILLNFGSNGASVGAIGTANSNTYYALNSTKAITTNGASNIVPCTSSGVKQGGGYMTLGDASYPFNDLYLSGEAKAGQFEASGGGSTKGFHFSASGSSADVANVFCPSGNTLAFGTNNTERARIDSSGNLLVGKTTANITTVGHQLLSDSSGDYAAHTTNNTRSLLLNRLGDDGDIIEFRKDSSPVGSIGATGGQLKVTANTNLVLSSSSNTLAFTNALAGAGSANDAVIDLGISNRRFKDLYLSGGVYLGGTGSANKLDDYEEGTWTPTYQYYDNGYQNFPSISYNVQEGFYTKVGRKVTVIFSIRVSSLSKTGVPTSAAVYVAGLPFTATFESTGICGAQNQWLGEAPSFAQTANTRAALRYLPDGSGGYSSVEVSDMGTSTNNNRLLDVTITYFTNA